METVVPPRPDEELNLLTEWGDPDIGPRTGRAAVASVAFHLVLIGILIYLPSGGYEPPAPEKEAAHHVTPLVLPPIELTQKAPNTKKLNNNFDAREIAPTPEVARAAKPPRPSMTPAPPPPPPPPKPAATPAPNIPEPPKVEMPKEQPKVEVPAIAQAGPQLPPQIQPQETPKLPLEGVPSPRQAIAPGRGKIPIPSTSVNDVMKDVIRGSGNGGHLVIGDQGALGNGYGSINQTPGNGAPGAALELLSDPGGADFTPYIRQIIQTIKRNWIAVQPESVRMGRRGKVVLQFQIRPNGVVDRVVFEEHSGADALDRAAVAGVSASNPLPPLPPEFKGDRVVLRLNFMYNMPR